MLETKAAEPEQESELGQEEPSKTDELLTASKTDEPPTASKLLQLLSERDAKAQRDFQELTQALKTTSSFLKLTAENLQKQTEAFENFTRETKKNLQTLCKHSEAR